MVIFDNILILILSFNQFKDGLLIWKIVFNLASAVQLQEIHSQYIYAALIWSSNSNTSVIDGKGDTSKKDSFLIMNIPSIKAA